VILIAKLFNTKTKLINKLKNSKHRKKQNKKESENGSNKDPNQIHSLPILFILPQNLKKVLDNVSVVTSKN
jgi:hypothetical protein